MKPSLFDGHRLTVDDSIELTIQSLRAYGPRHPHWAIAWSGGKDSTACLTLIVHLIETGRIPAPKKLTVLYADTRMELTPLAFAAAAIMAELRRRSIDVRVVMAPIDDRFFVYMFGRGVPPPSNTFRWCTPQIKVEPMETELRRLVREDGGDRALVITGVRQGESAVRDNRIAMSCGKDGAECGQGWYQQALPETLVSTLAPILHWRVCHVWDWLRVTAPNLGQPSQLAAAWDRLSAAVESKDEHEKNSAKAAYNIARTAAGPFGWPTAVIAEAYGGDEAEEINARTGCVGCPLASRDKALEAIIELPQWLYLAPLLELRPLYRALKLPQHRLRKPGGETRQDGTLAANQHRMGPLTMDARRWGMATVLDIQARINAEAERIGRPRIDILNAEEVARINELIELNTWPRKWSGDEPRADEAFDEDASAMLWPTVNGTPTEQHS